MSRLKLSLLALAALLALSVLTSTAASAAEPEAPFWTVGGKRLEANETKQLTTTTTAGTEARLHGTIKGVEVETRCKKGILGKAYLIGSKPHTDGRLFGVDEYAECKLFAKEGEKFNEQPKCEVAPFNSNNLAGRLWLEGTKAAGGETKGLVLEPEKLTEGKPILAEEKISNKGSETCTLAEEKSKIEGSVAAHISPEREAAEKIELRLVAKAVSTWWQPGELQEPEKVVELKHEGKAVTIESEMGTELTSKEPFGPTSGIGYNVEGAKLEAGQTKEITSKAKTEFTLKGEQEILGVKVKSVTNCKKLKLNAADKPVLVGGEPGKSEKEDIEFEECSATLGGSKCSSVTIESALANNELVTVVSPAGKRGKLASLFTPASGKVFTKIKFTKCGLFGSQSAEVEGSSTALVGSEKTEAVTGTLVYSETEEITEIEKLNGTKEKTGLKFGGFAATINGEAEVELVSKEKWGAF
jgi:hypothetical protein